MWKPPGKVYECKARGAFRNKGDSPCVGDYVEILHPSDGYWAIEKILPRKNRLVRRLLQTWTGFLSLCLSVTPRPTRL